MASSSALARAARVYVGVDLDDVLDEDRRAPIDSEPVLRPDGSTYALAAVLHLLTDFEMRRENGEWSSDRAASDRWLAPRLHAALRLPRTVAADKAVWHHLAIQHASAYVSWRWDGAKGVAADRWYGAIHKQALARLWWGAELFRDGPDYRPAERAFIRQDLPNSYLHRPMIRCRSFALGILQELTTDEGEALSSGKVNDLARVLNLCAAGAPPEAHVGFQQDDNAAFEAWAAEDADVPSTWDLLPIGPDAFDTTSESIDGGRRLAAHGMQLTI